MPRKTTKKTTEADKEIKEAPKPVEPIAVADDSDDMDDYVPTEKELSSKPDRYFEAVGRRKTAVARVRLFTRGEKQFLVNNKSYQEYFSTLEDQDTATASLRKMKCLDKFRVT